MLAVGIAFAAGLFIPAVTNTTAVAQPACTTDSLSLMTGNAPDPDSTDQGAVVVFVTNIGVESCSVPAYPSVELVGPDDPQFGPSYQLPQQPGDGQPLTIEPGYYVSSLLTYLPGPTDGPGWVPDSIVMTLPDASKPLVTPWISGDVSVLRQDAATNPGTFIGPLEHAG